MEPRTQLRTGSKSTHRLLSHSGSSEGKRHRLAAPLLGQDSPLRPRPLVHLAQVHVLDVGGVRAGAQDARDGAVRPLVGARQQAARCVVDQRVDPDAGKH